MLKFTNIIFWIKRFRTDWKENKKLILCADKTESLQFYYIRFEEEKINLRGGNKPFQFDPDGIPLVHSYIDVDQGKGYYYYPITIGQYALAVYHSFLRTGSEEKKHSFLNLANWFYQNRTEEGASVYWLSPLPKPEYKLLGPWKSAFAQSRALSVLLRAWQIEKKEQYLDICRKALMPFTMDTDQGGVTAHLNSGHPFYEEYVAGEPTMVLDGHIFSLFGLFDFFRAVTRQMDSEINQLSRKLFYAGVESLLYWLPQFDLGYWLRFNLCKMKHYPAVDPCTIGYLRLIRHQLKVIFDLTGDTRIQHYYAKIAQYDRLPNIARMYPVKYRALKMLRRL